MKIQRLNSLHHYGHIKKKSKFPYWTPEKPTSDFLPQRFYNSNLFLNIFFIFSFMASIQEHHIYVWEKSNSCNRTHSHTNRFIFIDSFTDILYYYTQFDELYFCVHSLYKWDTHTHIHKDIALYIYRFMNRYTVLLYTSCTDWLYFCLHDTLLYTLTLTKHGSDQVVNIHQILSDFS